MTASPQPAPQPNPSPAAPRPQGQGPQGLTGHTLRGTAWYLLTTLLSKGITTLTQVVLAWLLLEQDFGLMALAMTVAAFSDLLRQAGLRQVLVHRQADFHAWAGPGAWMSLALGVFAGLLMLAAGPVAAELYDAPAVRDLIWIMAIASPFQALATIPTARLETQLRFRAVAAVRVYRMVATAALTIGFAAMGFGALAFALPVPLVAVSSLVLLWRQTDVRLSRDPGFHAWRSLLGDGSLLLIGTFATTAVSQGDYIVLGLTHDAATVGVYFFAFNLSIQTITLATQSLMAALFPALSKLKDEPERQAAAFVRALRALAFAGVPLSLLQAALADPGLRLLFDTRWLASIPLLQILSLGMALRVVTGPCVSMFEAQGRYMAFIAAATTNAVTFFAAIGAAAHFGDVTTVAWAAAAHSTLLGPGYMLLALRPHGTGLRALRQVFAGPILAGPAAVGAAWWLGQQIPADTSLGLVTRIAVVSLATGVLYLALARALMPALTREVLGYAKALRRRRG